MPAKILPDRDELKKMLDRGMTHAEIAAFVSQQTGHHVRRSTVSAAVHRAGLSGQAKRYADTIPWTVRQEHLTAYPARMLRLLGRRRAGLQNSTEQDARLDSWLETLRENAAVVAYVPDTEQGWWYVPGAPTKDGVPIDPDFDPFAEG